LIVNIQLSGFAISALCAKFQSAVAVREPTRDPPQFVAHPAGFARLVERLSRQKQIALDTEAASFHRYVDRVYLIQVTDDEGTVLVDPLAIEDLSPLGRILADPSIEIVLHDADYDLRILNRDYGFSARNLFDTRVAAQFVGEPAVGLGALLERYFSITINKKLQRADWSRRPLTSDMIEYAADDTRYLPALRDRLKAELELIGRLDWATEEFKLLEHLRWTQPVSDELAFTRIKGAKSLPPRSLAILRELHLWRESTAKSLDRAPFRVLANSALLAVARIAPRDVSRLKGIAGLPESAVDRYGTAIVDAVIKGLGIPRKELPAIERPARLEHDREYDRRLERLKNLRNKRAKDIKMDPGMLCPNGTLQAVARAAPKTEKQLARIKELKEWQTSVLDPPTILSTVRGEDSG